MLRAQAIHAARQEDRSEVMVVATRTATVRDEDGKEMDIKAGITRIANRDHYLIATYPDLFERNRS